ncbi:unnamed protein product [Bursaphelenchus okinawaensis]|uniref:Uncharacterized protein n=1 Tax=Bursaphelenchus okinawaensis TaxID=465554 RepID=A0A811JPS7_9BILA|nr:unnamed protein product [Bursaphelenchus okinawaensis]CAG9076964.1 unnamed protein product [Bursaphelenchus okinawaensis]
MNFPLDCSPTDQVFEEVSALFEDLANCCREEIDEYRLPRYLELLKNTKTVFVRVLSMRKLLESNVKMEFDEEYRETHNAIWKILKMSFEEDIRRVQANLGLVAAVGELLILYVHIYGIKKDKVYTDTVRAIGNLLTNLTFGNSQSKKRLCAHYGFLETVTHIIDEVPEMTQAYGALVRNLSWNADMGMMLALQKTVRPFAAASVQLYQQRLERNTQEEYKCLHSTFAALWNLAGHSSENKLAICETDLFIPSLISQLNTEPENTAFMENASGVLKYISVIIASSPSLLKVAHEAKIVRHLVDLLNSSSFTVIINALGALCHLVAKDEKSQLRIFNSEQAGIVLESLKNSAREDVRNAVKTVLTHLNSSHIAEYALSLPRNANFGHYNSLTANSSHGFRGMSSSYGGDDVNITQRSLLQRRMLGKQNTLPRRNDVCSFRARENSPKLAMTTHGHTMGGDMNFDLNTNGLASDSANLNNDSRGFLNLNTNSQASGALNLNSQPSGATYTDSRSSGAPPTDSQASTNQHTDSDNHDLVLQAGLGLSESTLATRNGSFQSISGDVPTNWKSNMTTTRNSGNQSPSSLSELPDSPSHYSKLSDHEDFDDEQVGKDKHLLHSAIASALPKPSRLRKGNEKQNDGLKHNESPRFNESMKLNDGLKQHQNGTNERILDKCIARVIPKPKRNLKFGENGSSRMKNSSILVHPNTTEKVRDASNLNVNVEDSEFGEDNFHMIDLPNGSFHQLPADVDAELSADRLVIDCLNLSSTSNKAKNYGRLPEPKRINVPKSAARVPPFNYKVSPQKPVEKPARQKMSTKFGEFTLTNL